MKEYKYDLSRSTRCFLANSRKMKGYTQAEFGKLIGVKSYGYKETYGWGVSHEDICKISEALGLGSRLFRLSL